MAIATSSIASSGFQNTNNVKAKDGSCASANQSGSSARGAWIDCTFPGTSYVSTVLFTTASSQNAYYDVTLYYTGGSATVHSNISTGVGDYNKNTGKYYKVTKVRVAVSSTSTGNTPCIDYVALDGAATLNYSYTISNLVNNAGTLTGTVNLDCGKFVIPSNASQSLTINYGGKTKTITRSSNSSTWSFSIDVSDCTSYVTSVTSTVVVDGISKTGTHSVTIDPIAPTISFPSATYDIQHYEGETVTLFTGSDVTDKSLDYEYKVYVGDQLYTQQSNVKTNTLKLPYFDNMPESYPLKVEVRAKQSSDTTNGVGKDIWSSWYTSPTMTIKSPVLFHSNFSTAKWYQDAPIGQAVFTSPFTEFESKHYCNGSYHSSTLHTKEDLTPPLLYTPLKPNLWSYEYYVITRVKVEGQWSGWYKSPTIEVQFNVQPNDIEFNKDLPPYLIQGEITTVEWAESLDPNSTKTTYTVSLMNNVTEEIFEYTGVTENRLTFTTPRDILSDKVTFSVVAYSDGLYSNPVSSPQFAITDVNVMDCTLDFPILTTNVTGQFQNIILEINGDRRITKLENIVDYELPIHYFRSGLNTLKLIATDRNGVEVNRTWKINLDLNKEDLVIQKGKVNVEGYLSFNYDPQENYVECAKIGSNNLDLGIEEYELYGSTPFEGATNVTQKLVITRDNDDDLTQLRTLKITGAIE